MDNKSRIALMDYIEDEISPDEIITLQITDIPNNYAYSEDRLQSSLILSLLSLDKLIPKQVFVDGKSTSIFCYPRVDFIHENDLISVVLDYPNQK